MTPTTQLRLLRTPLRAYPTTLSTCASRRPINAPWRHVQQQQQQQRPSRAVFYSTTIPLRRDEALASRHRDDAFSALSSTATSTFTSTSTPTTTTLTNLSPAAANPPATTRPPPLELPTRGPDTAAFAHLFATGKAYLGFYKTGLKNIYLNWRLLRSIDTASGLPQDLTPSSSSLSSPSSAPNNTDLAHPPTHRPVGTTTRSALVLRRRVRHDLRRLPLFGLLLLLCGELTPFVVLAAPGLVPFTCRIPRQVESLRRQTEERRRRSLVASHDDDNNTTNNTPSTSPTSLTSRARATAQLARALNLASPLWDRLGLPDGAVAAAARARVRRHLAFLEEDDALLRQAGGASALEPEEVLLACEDRAIDVGAVQVDGHGEQVLEGVGALREQLARWMYLTEPVSLSVSGEGEGKGKGQDAMEEVGTREVIACVLLSGGDRDRPRSEYREMAAECSKAWGGGLV